MPTITRITRFPITYNTLKKKKSHTHVYISSDPCDSWQQDTGKLVPAHLFPGMNCAREGGGVIRAARTKITLRLAGRFRTEYDTDMH